MSDPRFEPRQAPEARTLPTDEVPEHGERGYAPLHPRGGAFDLLKKLAGPIVVAGVLLLKFGGLILKLKFVTTFLSMFVSIAAYASVWGLPFAVGLVALLLIHELGHVFELKRQGVPMSAPLFVPFLGAWVGMKRLPDDAGKEASVALAGPILGAVGAAGFWVAGEATGSDLLIALAFVGFLLNLVNLIPIRPLDGGFAFAALHPRFWRSYRDESTYGLDLGGRVLVGVVYFGLAAALALSCYATYIERDL